MLQTEVTAASSAPSVWSPKGAELAVPKEPASLCPCARGEAWHQGRASRHLPIRGRSALWLPKRVSVLRRRHLTHLHDAKGLVSTSPKAPRAEREKSNMVDRERK